MIEKNLITLCILTFNREQSVFLLIKTLVDKQVNKIANIYIIDDGSEDGTANKLAEFTNQDNITFVSNKENHGFAKTFLKCLKECRTEYLVICTDDEIIIPEGLSELSNLIQISEPDFISTKFKSKNAGREHSNTSLMNFQDIWHAAKHIPGLVFKKSSALSVSGILEEKLESNNTIAFFWPQIYLLLLMQASEMKLLKSPIILSAKNLKGSQPSQIINSKGQNYSSLSSVTDRFIDFKDIYSSLIKNPKYHKSHADLRLLLKKHDRSFTKMIESAIYFENPDLLRVFRKSVLIRLFRFKFVYRYLKEKLNFYS